MVRRVPDLAKVRRLIGYRPTRDLDQILADVLAEQAAGGRSAAGPRRSRSRGSPARRPCLECPGRQPARAPVRDRRRPRIAGRDRWPIGEPETRDTAMDAKPRRAADLAESIRAYFRDDPSRMTMMAARKFAVPEQAVVDALVGQWPIVRLRDGAFRDLMEALPDLGTDAGLRPEPGGGDRVGRRVRRLQRDRAVLQRPDRHARHAHPPRRDRPDLLGPQGRARLRLRDPLVPVLRPGRATPRSRRSSGKTSPRSPPTGSRRSRT